MTCPHVIVPSRFGGWLIGRYLAGGNFLTFEWHMWRWTASLRKWWVCEFNGCDAAAPDSPEKL